MSDIVAPIAKVLLPETIGRELPKTIAVEIGTRFLQHFSEQLYSSPQKAFEELISNGWDAGADYVDVRVPADLNAPNAALCVLDNGNSMNFQGLENLWHIAHSVKEANPIINGRPVIGKFGIGKLSTYVLANKLTYICKSSDGVIRRVTMDYGKLEQNEDSLISTQSLKVFEVEESDVFASLKNIDHGDALVDLVSQGVPKPTVQLSEDEYGSIGIPSVRVSKDTWTLVILSDLKDRGKRLKTGILKRMLEAALPFGSQMAIKLNDALLTSSKIDFETVPNCDWRIGADLNISSFTVEDDAEDETEGKVLKTDIPVTTGIDGSGQHFLEIPKIGRITGRVRLFKEIITGGKSEYRGASNGFHVNVLGRVVNQKDPSFGEENLSHAAWARFRMAVRVDGLNTFLTTNREQFKDIEELKIFRAFLRKVFNVARSKYDSDENAEMPSNGDRLVQSLGVISLSPLRNVVTEVLAKETNLASFIDDNGITDKLSKRKSWEENTAENIRTALSSVKYDNVEDENLVRFRLADNSIVVNKEHPFYQEHSKTKAEKDLLGTVAMIQLLTDLYAFDIGVEPGKIESIRHYRDRLMRHKSLQTRQSGTYIAKLLLATQHDSANSKHLELVVSDALAYIGFSVKDLAKSGEPEGIASAYVLPTNQMPTADNPQPPLYSFSFDAKSSKHEAAKTGNINLAGVVEHRDRYNANYALVIAPGYSEGALETRCEQQKVTPITAKDLGRLLEYTVEYGAIPLTKLKELFDYYDPKEVSGWVDSLKDWLKAQRSLTIDVFISALDSLKGQIPDTLTASTIALECRRGLGITKVLEADVIAVAHGLAILAPDLIGIDGSKIIVNASAQKIAATVHSQLEKLHNL